MVLPILPKRWVRTLLSLGSSVRGVNQVTIEAPPLFFLGVVEMAGVTKASRGSVVERVDVEVNLVVLDQVSVR